MIAINKDFAIVGDTTVNQPVETVGEGYIVVCSGESGILKVTE